MGTAQLCCSTSPTARPGEALMAKPIDYEVKPTPTDPTAREELDTLLQSLHERGVLRFANDLVCAQTDIAKVVVDGLGKQETLNAIQNLSILGMAHVEGRSALGIVVAAAGRPEGVLRKNGRGTRKAHYPFHREADR